MNTYEYDVFGEIRASTGAQANDFTFAGEQVDDSTGLQYLRARYYDPMAGRFLSTDPLGGGYAYAGNSPVNATDPSGLITCGGTGSSWSQSGPGGVNSAEGCYDTSGNVVACQGTCPASLNDNQAFLSAYQTGDLDTVEVVQDIDNRGAPMDQAAKPTVVAVQEGNAILVDTDPGIIRAHARKPSANNISGVEYGATTRVIGDLSQNYYLRVWLEAEIGGSWYPVPGTQTQPATCLRARVPCDAGAIFNVSQGFWFNPPDALRTGFEVRCPSCDVALPWAHLSGESSREVLA